MQRQTRKAPNALRDIARRLRNNPTEVEKQLWNKLKHGQLYNLKFRRQHPIDKYIVDFVCLDKRVVIELDGGQHATESHVQKDLERDAWLQAEGYSVLRFWNNQIIENMEGVLYCIQCACLGKTPPP